MPGIKAAFGLGHPFFQQACELRQKQWTVYQVLEAAREAGYIDLTWAQVNYGLRHAPADLFLPTRTARHLRERYETLEKNFDSYVSMRDLAQEALVVVADILEELDNPELTTSRRGWLENNLWRWYGRAFEWSTACSALSVKLMELGLEHRAATPVSRVEDTDEHIEALAGEFREKLGLLTGDVSSDFDPKDISLPVELNDDDEDDDDLEDE